MSYGASMKPITPVGMCDHEYVHLRQETMGDPPGARYADSVTRDVFYCKKCLQYKYVEIKRKRYGEY